MTQRELYQAIYGNKAINHKVDVELQADLKRLSLEASRALGTRVVVGPSSVLIDCQNAAGVSDTLERLGVRF